MDAGFIFNQPSSEALKRAYSNGGSTSASQNQNMSAPTSGGNNSVIQPFFDPHWLPQLIGPSPRGTPTFWDQPFGQVMPGGDATAGAFPQDKDYFSGATLSLDKISNAAPQPQVSSNSNPGDLSRKASSSDAPSADASSSHVPASYAGTKRQVATKASATTFDLTKRKNWAHHLMHVLPDFAHVLSFDGNITYASPSVHDLAGYEPSELVGQTFADLIHPEDQLAYLSQFKEVVVQPEAPPLFLYFRLRSKDGSYQLMELTGHARHEPTQQSTASGSAIPSDNKCFFGTARPYPSKNASMVDSFVEHKMENERLKARLARLTAEVGDIAPVEAQRVQMDSQFSKGSRTAVDDALNKTYNKSSAPQQTSTPNLTVSPQFTTLHAPSVRHNAAPPSSVSTLSRPEAAEPSAPSATTITDYSSAVPPANKKSKSRRPAADDNNYVCHDCGTADSPEWRRGPLGPKTLCNACGLRWAKKAKGPKPTRHSAAGTATH